ARGGRRSSQFYARSYVRHKPVGSCRNNCRGSWSFRFDSTETLAAKFAADVDPRALTILHEWLKATGAEMSKTRMRKTRLPNGADLVLNEVSGAPGLCQEQIIEKISRRSARSRLRHNTGKVVE